MKKILFCGLICLMLFFNSAFAAPDVLPIQSVSTVLSQLKSQGYVAFEKIELKGEEYQVLAIGEDGVLTYIRINIHNGEVMEMKKASTHISMLDVVDKVEAKGYSSISKIETNNGNFIVQAISPSGKQVTLTIDAVSGELLKS